VDHAELCGPLFCCYRSETALITIRLYNEHLWMSSKVLHPEKIEGLSLSPVHTSVVGRKKPEKTKTRALLN